MENMTPKRPEAHLPEPWLRGPIPGCLTDLGKSVPRQPLPGGRGSVSDCKHTAPLTEPRPQGSGCRAKTAKSPNRLSPPQFRGYIRCSPRWFIRSGRRAKTWPEHTRTLSPSQLYATPYGLAGCYCVGQGPGRGASTTLKSAGN
jgi:hypothetical protein